MPLSTQFTSLRVASRQAHHFISLQSTPVSLARLLLFHCFSDCFVGPLAARSNDFLPHSSIHPFFFSPNACFAYIFDTSASHFSMLPGILDQASKESSVIDGMLPPPPEATGAASGFLPPLKILEIG